MACAAELRRAPSRRRRRRASRASLVADSATRTSQFGGGASASVVRARGVAAPSRGGSNPDESEHRAAHPRPEPARVAARAGNFGASAFTRSLLAETDASRPGRSPGAPRREPDARGAFGWRVIRDDPEERLAARARVVERVRRLHGRVLRQKQDG